MYFAQLDEEDKSFKCYVAEEIIADDDIVYSSEMEKEVDEFCKKWNRTMKYYNYNEVKNLTKGTNLIVLLTVIGEDYIGLAQQDKLYKIKKNNNHFYEKFDFLVCTKVLEKNNNYLIPIGYSDEDQWLEQEEEYKQKLFSNEAFDEENEILKICKELKYGNGSEFCWNNISKNIVEYFEELEDIKDEIEFNYMLYKVVKRCYQEKFPIQEYRLFEIPYGDNNGWIMDFVHGQDYDNFHIRKLKNIKFREIDFWVKKNGIAIPQFFNPETSGQWSAADCNSAVWYEQNEVLIPPQSSKYYIYKLENGECGIAIEKKDLPLIGEVSKVTEAETIIKAYE
ncbi:hypothetical protein HYH68_16490 [Clostridium botulinum]|uniref:hypothetical protein n=1 Tax=Clostridium botulinum TaxID=1491 RepID=UPI001C9A4A7D|nr:hypothetical protein [Clostridium botulinum]MBY6889392.1 hypothetical protein [Clostridium botulinum]